MWFYNVTSNKCEQFIYGGCDGNKNLFSSEKQCQMLCSEYVSNSFVVLIKE